GIGMAITATSLVAPALGARDFDRARRLSTHATLLAAVAMAFIAAAVWLILPLCLGGLGAAGRTFALAPQFLHVVLASLPMLAMAMTSSAVLRSAGDAHRAMYVTLVGAGVAVLLDAALILGLGLGIHGAAVSAFVTHAVMLGIGWWSVVRVHGLLERPR